MRTPNAHCLLALGFAALSTLGCGPAQWLVTVNTDAPVPQLGDTLLLQVLDERGELACSACSRVFPVEQDERWPRTFGVAPEVLNSAETLHIRAQLFRSDHVQRDGELVNVYLDAVGRLPPLDGKTPAFLPLRTECFGVRSRLTPWSFSTCDPATGELGPEPELGRPPMESQMRKLAPWAPAQDVPCRGSFDPAKMACVEGGAFIMGGVSYLGAPADKGNRFAAAPEMLVALSPFALDKDELLVKDFVALQKQYSELQAVKPLTASEHPLCNLKETAADAASGLPLNCIDHQMAEAICRAQKKRLPTEAEWEFAAGERRAENPYPWGTDPDTCSHAVVGRGTLFSGTGIDVTCRVDAQGKPVAIGPIESGHPLDVTPRGLRNLGGNVAEWTQDAFTLYSSPCWGRRPIFRNWLLDPVCSDVGPTVSVSSWVTRGGAWGLAPSLAAVIQRSSPLPALDRAGLSGYSTVGVRCAISM